MLTVREHVDIDAAIEDVFDYMDEPAHQADITPSLTRSEFVERLPNGGSRATYTYRILGVSFTGEVRATDYVPPKRIVWTMDGDLRGTIRWYFATDSSHQTTVTYSATYALPGPSVVRPLLAPLVRRYNEREVRALLRQLREQMEGQKHAAESM